MTRTSAKSPTSCPLRGPAPRDAGHLDLGHGFLVALGTQPGLLHVNPQRPLCLRARGRHRAEGVPGRTASGVEGGVGGLAGREQLLRAPLAHLDDRYGGGRGQQGHEQGGLDSAVRCGGSRDAVRHPRPPVPEAGRAPASGRAVLAACPPSERDLTVLTPRASRAASCAACSASIGALVKDNLLIATKFRKLGSVAKIMEKSGQERFRRRSPSQRCPAGCAR